MNINSTVASLFVQLKQRRLSFPLFSNFSLAKRVIVCLIVLVLTRHTGFAANETFGTGSFIINMGIAPQTPSNGLKPYGLIYELIKNYDVPVKWVINPSKIKDGIDFTYNGQNYRGGTFIIHAEFRTAAVNALIASWQAKGVIGVTTIYPISLDVTLTLGSAPKWAIDPHDANRSKKILDEADIPSTAYYYRTPAMLNSCDDLFMSPHSDAKWNSHQNLFFWNLNSRGSIWAGGKTAGNMEGDKGFNHSNPSQSLRFLSTGGLLKSAKKGTPPYSYMNVSDPVFQMIGPEDDAHKGHDELFLPSKPGSDWYPGVKISCYDPTHHDIPGKSNGPAAATLYGRGFDNPARGYVMYQGGHDIGGNNAEEVSAQREFFNYALIVAPDKSPGVSYANVPSLMNSGVLYNNLTATPSSPVGLSSFTYKWYSTIGGTFSAVNSATTNYTPPVVVSQTPAFIYCKITDACGRSTINPVSVSIFPPSSAPVAVNDTIRYTNLCNTSSRTINVLSNDSDPNGNMVNSISFIGGGNHGTFTNNGNGSVTYTPGWLFQGIDTMRYQVCDNTPLCSQATIVITTPDNGICTLSEYYRIDTVYIDSIQYQNSITTPDEAIGDFDASNGSNANTAQFNNDNDSIIVRLSSAIGAGDTIRIRMADDNATCIDLTASGSLTAGGFIPGVNSSDFTIPGGTADIFNYYNLIVSSPTQYVKIVIRPGGCSNKINLDAMRAIHRYCTSAVPIAIDDAISTGKNTAITSNIRSNDTDPQSLPLSIDIVSNPANGTAGINGAGNIVYTPDSGYTGTDQVIYRVCNTNCLCDTAFVTYTILDNPCASNQVGTFTSGHATAVMSSLNATNPNDALGIPDASNGSNALSAIIVNVIGSNVVLDLTDTVPSSDTIVIRMAPDNASANTITVEGNLTNAWGSPTTTTVFNLPAASDKIFANYNFIVSGQTRFIRIRQTTTTGGVDADAVSFDFWKCTNIPNRPPVANNDTTTTYANRAVDYGVTSNDADPDGNSFSVSIINPPASNGSANVNGNNITYTPDFGFTGVDTVMYKLCDTGTPSLCDTALFIVTTAPGPPVAMTDNSTTPSATPILVNVQSNDTLSVNAFTYTTSLMESILSASNGSAVLAGNSIQYTPNADFTGIDSVAYEICDNDSPAACDTAILYITVTNQAPTANDDTITTSACNAVIIDVVSNDTDPENGTLTVTSVSVPSNGSAVISNNQIVYTPSDSPVFTGIATFSYQVCDNGNSQQCTNGNVSVTVNSNNPPSDPPNAVADTDSTFINEILPIFVLNNDTDPNADSLEVDSTASGLLAPALGTIEYLDNGQIQYTPDPGVMGLDSFEYKVCDIHHFGAGCINIISTCSIAKVYVSINNRPPAANDDFFSTTNTFAISNSVAANDDVEPDGQGMTYSLITPPAMGSVIVNADGTFTYTPDGVFIGDEFFTYLVCDDATPSMCDTALVTISVTTSNVPPNAVADTIITYGVTPYSGNVGTNDNDPNGNLDPAGFTLITGPINGDIIFNPDGSYTYTAYNGFTGIEYVYYEVCDTGNPVMCSYATLNIIVPDSAPVTITDTLSVNEDLFLNVPPAGGIISNGDFDPNGTVLTVDTVPVTNAAYGALSVMADGSFTYLPDSNFNGTDFFIVNVCDSSSLCTADTVYIIVNPVNDQVILVNDANTTPEDTPVNGLIITAGDYDIDTTGLVVNTTPVAGPAHGGIVVDAAGNYTYTPDLNFNGTDTIIFNVCDGGTPMPATCLNDTLIITVIAVNDPPVIENDTTTLTEENTFNGTIITAGDFDPDSTTLTIDTVPIAGPANGTFDIDTAGNYTYTPDPDFNGTDTIIISVCDSGNPLPGICVNDTLIFNVTASNDAPVIVNDNNTTNEDVSVAGTIITGGDTDPDGTPLIVDTIPLSGPANGIFIIDTTGSYTYTPSTDFNGVDTIVISICDNGIPLPSICVNDTLIITVNPINDAPVITNDTAEVDEDSYVIGSVISGLDTDIDGVQLTADTVPVSGPAHGSIIINTDGTYQYTPSLNYNGDDVVIIDICDDGSPLPSICVHDTLYFTVHPVNDTVVVANDIGVTDEDTPFSGNILTGADYDIDTTALSVNTTPVSGPSHGLFIAGSPGTYTYTPSADFYGEDTVVLSVCDSGRPLPAFCINDTLFITVNPVNDPPATMNDSASVCSGLGVQASPLLNDTDIDQDTLSISSITQPVNGLAISDGINIIYIPDAGFIGNDSLDYTACDNGIPQLCSSGKVFFTVTGIISTGITVNDILCNGDSTGSVTTAPVGITPFLYSWNTGATTQNISGVPAGNYTVTITDSLGCSKTDSATVQQPAAGLSASASATHVKCFGDNSGEADLSVAGGTPPYIFQWNNGDTNEDLLQVFANTYSVLITDGNGCTETVSAVVSQPATPLTFYSIVTPANCLENSNGLIDITVNGGTPGYVYSWSNGQSGEDLSEIAGTYTVTVSDTNGCVKSSPITINDVSAVLIISSASSTFCEGISTTMSTTSSGGVFQWYENGVPISGASDSSYVTGQTGDYYLTLTHSCGNFVSNTLNILVNPIPALTINGGLTMCEGSSSQLDVTGADNFQWSPSTGLSDSGIGNPIASPASSTTYTITGTSLGCAKDTTVTVTVNPLPVVTISSSTYDCEKGTQLTATGGTDYIWSPSTGLDSINIPNPIAVPDGTTQYFVTVTNSYMCSASGTILIVVDCDSLIIPDGFSPDGDGVNDLFVIDGLEKYPGTSLEVFNRWGNVIYSTSDYDNSWDAIASSNGITLGEGKVPPGTYFYILKLGVTEINKTGYLIIRY